MKKLAMLFLLCASVAKADTYQTHGMETFTFDLPHGTQFFAGEYLTFPVDWLGGVLEGSLYIPDSSLDNAFSLGSVISAPPDFVSDPNVPWNFQWPYSPWDYMPEYVDLAHPLSITTPEPSTVVLLGACLAGLLLWKAAH